MNRLMELRLAQFVDRDDEMERFCHLIEHGEQQPIMVVWGESGMGKTSLLARMIHECAQRKIRKAEVVWKESNPPDYMAVMRKIRDDVGLEHFGPFTDLINYFTLEGYRPSIHLELVAPASTVSVANAATITQSRVGDIGGVIIKDSMIVVPRPDMAVSEIERRTRLTRRFHDNLKAALSQGPLVIFLDAVEKMSTDTHNWIWEQLLEPIRDVELTGVRFVLCGQKPPPQDHDWKPFVREAALKPLRERDIVAYLAKRFPESSNEERQSVAAVIFSVTNGMPASVATMADIVEKRKREPATAHV